MASEFSSGLSADKTYYGYWVDHSKPFILGSTITVSSDAANIIVALLSLTIAFAGSHAWDLIALMLFHISAARTPQDGLDHQKQSILRNHASPGSFLLLSSKIYWRWKNIARTPMRRLIWSMALAFLSCAGFIVAGVMSAQIISSTGIEVLVASPACGHLAVRSDYFGGDPTTRFTTTTFRESLAYSRICFRGNHSSPACQVFVKEFVAYQASHINECPFPGFCSMSVGPAIQLDTGLMDTSDTFGLNAAVKDRLYMRKVTTCAPLNISSYVTVQPMDDYHAQVLRGTGPLPGELMDQVWLGPNPPEPETTWRSSYRTNCTSDYSASSRFYYGTSLQFQNSQYSTDPDWQPIAPLMKDNADMIITTISSNTITYSRPVDDPVFYAHHNITYSSPDLGVTTESYQADEIGCIHCTEQYQFCLPYNTTCTKLTGLFEALNQATTLDINGQQNATLYILAAALIGYSGPNDFSLPGWLSGKLDIIQASGLSSTTRLQVQLPDNQWEIEVEGWMSWILALLQGRIAEIAVGMGLPGGEQLELPDLVRITPTAEERILCRSLRMKAPKNVNNISVLGLGLIIGICGSIIAANLLLSNVLKLRYRRRRFSLATGPAASKDDNMDKDDNPMAFKMARWETYGELQVQRRAFEGFGVGNWRNEHGDVPVRIDLITTIFPGLETLVAVEHVNQKEATRRHSSDV